MEFVEQLKSTVDIVKVVGDYVRLRKLGHSYKGLCPFHSEKTPSFNVHATQQYFKCFGCGKGGDLIKFVMEIENIPFFEALTLLAERNGIPMPKRHDFSDPESKNRAALFNAQDLALELFRKNLYADIGAEARNYLKKRGITGELASEFSLGLSDRSGTAVTKVLQQQSFTPEQMTDSGLVLRREDGSFYDRFRGRLMFPIQNESGKVIGFGGRALQAGDEPKYMNSPATKLYDKGRTLYNLHRARQAARNSDRAVLVEGYMDVIGAWAAGVKEAVASCGTALTNSQVRIRRKYASRIVVNFDPDTAGVNATEKSIQLLLEENMHVRIVELPEGLDPDEYVQKHGAEAYQAQLEKAGNYFFWLADRARSRFDLKEAEGRIAALNFLKPSIQRIPDKMERAAVVNDVAAYLKLDADLLLQQFRKAVTDRKETRLEKPKYDLPTAEKMLLHSLLRSPRARTEVLETLAGLPQFDLLAGRRIFEVILELEHSGNPLRFEDLELRLNEDENTLMARLAFADDTEDEDILVKQALACLSEFRQRASRSEVVDLKGAIAAAERAGDMAGAIELMQQLKRAKSQGTN